MMSLYPPIAEFMLVFSFPGLSFSELFSLSCRTAGRRGPIPVRIPAWRPRATNPRRGRFALRKRTILSSFWGGSRNRLVIKIVSPLSHNAASDESLQRPKSVSILRCYKADGIPDRLRPSGPPDAVNIIFRVHRKIEIHDVRNPVHVNPSRRDIGCDEQADRSRFEGFQSIQALVLGTIRMEGCRCDLRSSQTPRDSVGAMFCPRENEH